MGDYDGSVFPLPYTSGAVQEGHGGEGLLLPYSGGAVHKGKPADWKFYPVPLGAQYIYRLRAWNLVTVDWEIWTSEGSPDTNPPSGNPVTGVTLIGVQEA